MSNEYSLLNVLRTLAKWKKHIIIITTLAAIASIVGSLLMPNYYKSTTVLAAASPTIANPDPIGGGEKVYYIYGTGEDLDRLFQIANSSEVKGHIIGKFNLAEYYDVDTSTLKGKAKLAQKFNKVYETVKTKFDGLELSIEDTDPKRAKDMVTTAREKIELVAQTLIKDSQSKVVSSLESSIENQESQLVVISDSLTRLKAEYDIYESYDQARTYGELTSTIESNLAKKEAMLKVMRNDPNVLPDSLAMAVANVAGIKSQKEVILDKVSRFNEGVLKVRKFEVEQNKMVEEVALEKERLKKLLASYNKEFTTVHIIEKESEPFEKSRPKRSIIVLGITLLAFVLSSLTALLAESTKDINWREIYAGKE